MQASSWFKESKRELMILVPPKATTVTLLTPVQSLFLSHKFSDVRFIVENTRIAAHKALLAASCPYFEAMLFGATNESKMTTIKLKNVSSKTFVEVLRAIYYQKVEINRWTAEEVTTLIQIADEYQFLRLGHIVAETLSENQITVDTVDDVYGVGKRLNCGPLICKCEEFVQKHQQFLLSNATGFDKLSMDLIEHLMGKAIFDPKDENLLYSISNWRNTGSIVEKKTLLSKLDWKHLPREYSEPLIRILLHSGDSGLKVNNWCKSVGAPASNLNKVASVYNSFENKFLDASALQTFLTQGCQVLNYSTRESHLMVHFRDLIRDVARITFTFGSSAQLQHNSIKASLSLTVFSTNGALQGKQESRGSISPPFYEFTLPKKSDVLVMRISFTNNNYNSYHSNGYGDNGRIHNFEFHTI